MKPCALCGCSPARDVSGKDRRLAFLFEKIRVSEPGARGAIARWIVEVQDEREQWRCELHETCGSCFLVDAGLEDCRVCGAPSCARCSLPAFLLGADGRIIESPNPGVLCARCNPPGFGLGAGRRPRVRGPAPVVEPA